MLSGRSILIVEDDPAVRNIVARLMEDEGADLTEAASSARAEVELQNKRFDLVLLDLGLPDDDGLNVLRRLRQRSKAPVIILTAKCDDIDELLGLELGADDYITKPFMNRVLLARMNNVLRHLEPTPTENNGKQSRSINIAGWNFNPAKLDLVSPEGESVPLTGAENRLLRALLDHRDHVMSREEISLEVLGRKLEGRTSIEMLVSRLRAKFKARGIPTSVIRTVHGRGYGIFSEDIT